MQKQGRDICAAVLSRTDEPEWARMCLEYLVLDNGVTTLASCFEERVEMGKEEKAVLMQRLHKATGVSYHEMSFFDNERNRIQDVQRKLPDYKCFYTPNGMSREAWDEAKRSFRWD